MPRAPVRRPVAPRLRRGRIRGRYLSPPEGLDIFAAGSPASVLIACDLSGGVSDVTETVTAGGSSLSYDATTDQYTYVWKTQKSWAGSCQRLVLRFTDGQEQTADFHMR